ncbi:MAG: hypothetical protein IT285_10120 [Bdellovibrionales bacterium]|nr:hypothetical protein [Bdellovibrionales bacterium]
MSGIRGKVGPVALSWKTIPRGPRGTAQLEIDGGDTLTVSWRRDMDGIWIELPDGLYGFDVRSVRGDDGSLSFDLSERGSAAEWRGLRFLRAGEEAMAGAGGAKSGNAKVKAEMPGKIVKVFAVEGQAVARGDRLLVMEAMKMENEILAPAAGKVSGLSVKPGESVEAGALLLTVVGGA